MGAAAAPLPVLVVVSGPAGSGKTTLANELGRIMGCPVISRDAIKAGMAHVTPGFVPAPGDDLTARALPVFFGLLDLLVRAGVTTVADAAFQDKVWRPRLEPFCGRARVRIVHCVVDADVAMERILRRAAADPLRGVHADPGPDQRAAQALSHAAFSRVAMDAPAIEVDTTDGYRPGLAEIAAFAGSPG